MTPRKKADSAIWRSALTCGCIIDVFVEAVNQQAFPDLGSGIDAHQPTAVATPTSGVNADRLGGRCVLDRRDVPRFRP